MLGERRTTRVLQQIPFRTSSRDRRYERRHPGRARGLAATAHGAVGLHPQARAARWGYGRVQRARRESSPVSLYRSRHVERPIMPQPGSSGLGRRLHRRSNSERQDIARDASQHEARARSRGPACTRCVASTRSTRGRKAREDSPVYARTRSREETEFHADAARARANGRRSMCQHRAVRERGARRRARLRAACVLQPGTRGLMVADPVRSTAAPAPADRTRSAAHPTRACHSPEHARIVRREGGKMRKLPAEGLRGPMARLRDHNLRAGAGAGPSRLRQRLAGVFRGPPGTRARRYRFPRMAASIPRGERREDLHEGPPLDDPGRPETTSRSAAVPARDAARPRKRTWR